MDEDFKGKCIQNLYLEDRQIKIQLERQINRKKIELQKHINIYRQKDRQREIQIDRNKDRKIDKKGRQKYRYTLHLDIIDRKKDRQIDFLDQFYSHVNLKLVLNSFVRPQIFIEREGEREMERESQRVRESEREREKEEKKYKERGNMILILMSIYVKSFFR